MTLDKSQKRDKGDELTIYIIAQIAHKTEKKCLINHIIPLSELIKGIWGKHKNLSGIC